MRALMVAVGAWLALPSVAHGQEIYPTPGSPWHVMTIEDALTDEITRRTCVKQDDVLLCISFMPGGVLAQVIAPSRMRLDPGQYPALRVDRLKAHEFDDAFVSDIERRLRKPLIPRATNGDIQTWLLQVPSESGKWEAAPPSIITELLGGERLLLRIYPLAGGWKDVQIPLAGFCEALAPAYLQVATPPACPGN